MRSIRKEYLLLAAFTIPSLVVAAAAVVTLSFQS